MTKDAEVFYMSFYREAIKAYFNLSVSPFYFRAKLFYDGAYFNVFFVSLVSISIFKFVSFKFLV